VFVCTILQQINITAVRTYKPVPGSSRWHYPHEALVAAVRACQSGQYLPHHAEPVFGVPAKTIRRWKSLTDAGEDISRPRTGGFPKCFTTIKELELVDYLHAANDW
ncbi:unnamed protein product, partial [Allacma fusca]